MKTVDYRKKLFARLRDPDYAVGYLSNVLVNEIPAAFYIALKDVIDARGENISSLAKKSSITRQALYKALAKDGNPQFATVIQILAALNLRLSGLELMDIRSKKKAA